MKIKELEMRAVEELEREDQEMAVEEIKERLRELRSAEMVLKRLGQKYQEFLEKGIDDVLF